MNYFKNEIIIKYQCILPFLEEAKNQTLEYCSNEITKNYIKKIKIVLQQKGFKHCQDQAPCNQTIFTLVNPEDRITYSSSPWAKIKISFEDFIVEEIVDTYIYSFTKKIAEIGGALAIFVGISCMTMIEFLIKFHEFVCKYQNTYIIYYS